MASSPGARRWRGYRLLLRLGDSRPRVGAEGGRPEALFISQIHHREVGPAVANGGGIRNLIAPDDYRVAFDSRAGVDELPVFARDGKAFRLFAIGCLEV